ncbi:hypothetical protein [Nioella aestuarii]|uniref:hypothetical protein n=1 Tax=Nioella aestuarii TaxID=1662864 RepID=UPI003D7FADB4
MFAKFLYTESGAVTVDWIVLTAFLCGLSIAVVSMLSVAAREPANTLNSVLADDVIAAHASFD